MEGIIFSDKTLWSISCSLIRGRLSKFKCMRVNLPLKGEFCMSEPARGSLLPSFCLTTQFPHHETTTGAWMPMLWMHLSGCALQGALYLASCFLWCGFHLAPMGVAGWGRVFRRILWEGFAGCVCVTRRTCCWYGCGSTCANGLPSVLSMFSINNV